MGTYGRNYKNFILGWDPPFENASNVTEKTIVSFNYGSVTYNLEIDVNFEGQFNFLDLSFACYL